MLLPSFFRKNLFITLLLTGLFISQSCQKTPALPDNFVSFQTNALGFPTTESTISIIIAFSRAATTAGTITINTALVGVVYDTQITTSPALVSNTIQVPVVIGDISESITLSKKSGALFEGTESMKFTISALPAEMIFGPNLTLNISFAQIISSGAAETTIDGGGANHPNKVFIDLSGNKMTSIPRSDWDLGFASGNDFRVKLNSANGMLALSTGKSDMNAVTAADTIGLGSRFSLGAVFNAIIGTDVPAWIAGTPAWIDDPSGDLSKTSITEVSSTDTSNKVYIINEGMGIGTPAPPLPWKKVRILRKGSGYVIQYADINATTFTETNINKDITRNFQYMDLEKGIVSVEPDKEQWDISWSGFTNLTNLGAGLVPYYFQDVILQNPYKVQTVQILNTTKDYSAFGESDLTTLNFGVQSQVNIGANWRTGGGPTSAPAIRNDRYYIIKDASNNVYKLRFTALDSNGERGKPKFEYALVKKG